MREGKETQNPLAHEQTRRETQREHPNLSAGQRDAVEQILANRDRVQALEGIAGAGKTTALAAVRDAAEREGYRVEGFAPTSRAAHQLREAGIASDTLQRHLIMNAPADHERRFYVLDESSLASTVQMHTFLRRLGAQHRVSSSATSGSITPWTPANPFASCKTPGSR
jgi:ATP-dependent exoDNAse (exonuclease V) alpha subunit